MNKFDERQCAVYGKLSEAIERAQAEGTPLAVAFFGVTEEYPGVYVRHPDLPGCCAMGCLLLGKPVNGSAWLDSQDELGISAAEQENLYEGWDLDRPSDPDAPMTQVGRALRQKYLLPSHGL